MKTLLDKFFSKEEISASLFNMHPSKAPGFDGLSIAFFQKLWNIAGDSTTHICLNILNNNGNLRDLNHTPIALIPKVDPKKVKYRLISLCTVIYKIISKTMTNRLKAFLSSLIFQEQRSFVLGRQILDNVLIAFETMHKIRLVKKGCSS